MIKINNDKLKEKKIEYDRLHQFLEGAYDSLTQEKEDSFSGPRERQLDINIKETINNMLEQKEKQIISYPLIHKIMDNIILFINTILSNTLGKFLHNIIIMDSKIISQKVLEDFKVLLARSFKQKTNHNNKKYLLTHKKNVFYPSIKENYTKEIKSLSYLLNSQNSIDKLEPLIKIIFQYSSIHQYNFKSMISDIEKILRTGSIDYFNKIGINNIKKEVPANERAEFVVKEISNFMNTTNQNTYLAHTFNMESTTPFKKIDNDTHQLTKEIEKGFKKIILSQKNQHKKLINTMNQNKHKKYKKDPRDKEIFSRLGL